MPGGESAQFNPQDEVDGTPSQPTQDSSDQRYMVGVQTRPDGSLDTSKALYMEPVDTEKHSHGQDGAAQFEESLGQAGAVERALLQYKAGQAGFEVNQMGRIRPDSPEVAQKKIILETAILNDPGIRGKIIDRWAREAQEAGQPVDTDSLFDRYAHLPAQDMADLVKELVHQWVSLPINDWDDPKAPGNYAEAATIREWVSAGNDLITRLEAEAAKTKAAR